MFYLIERAMQTLGVSPVMTLAVLIGVGTILTVGVVVALFYLYLYFDNDSYHGKNTWSWFVRRFKFGFFRYRRLTKGKFNIKY